MADTIETRILMPPVELNKGIRKTFFETIFATGSDKAHRIDVPLLRNGKTVSLSGVQVDGFFTSYAGDKTVHCAGTVSGNTVSVTLDKSCYTQTGPFAFVIQATLSGITNTFFWGESSIFASTAENIIDGDYIIYDLPELLKRIEAMKTATTNANSATKAAQAATTDANAATKAASTAATNANSATKAANTATTNANNATKAANTAAGKIDNMTVQVSGLEAGAAPTASLTLKDGHYNLSFAIPKGDKGNTGATGATPEITVKVVTGEAGTQASVAQSGTAENPVITLTIPRGDTGSLGGLTINGKAPDGAGKVTLTAADLGALDKDVHMYNLLDNSDLTNPVAQAGIGGLHGADTYAVDRWKQTSGATVSADANGLKIVSDKTNWVAGIQQKIEAKRFADVMTLAVRGVFPVACRLYVYIGSGTTNFGTAYFQGDAAERTLMLKLTKPDGLTGDEVVNVYISPDTGSTGTAAVVRWAALYEGEYTAETLPPYVPKGYAAELAECLRYYRKIKSNNETFAGYAANGVAYAFIPLQTMRIAPTVTGGGKFYYTLGSTQGTTTETATAHNANANRAVVKCAVSVTGICTGVITPQGDIDISADL